MERVLDKRQTETNFVYLKIHPFTTTSNIYLSFLFKYFKLFNSFHIQTIRNDQ